MSWATANSSHLEINRAASYSMCEVRNVSLEDGARSLPLMGFWCRESTKLRGFSMVYLMSRTVCMPPPSLHKPFLEDLAWSSYSQSLACSGLVAHRQKSLRHNERKDVKSGALLKPSAAWNWNFHRWLHPNFVKQKSVKTNYCTALKSGSERFTVTLFDSSFRGNKRATINSVLFL